MTPSPLQFLVVLLAGRLGRHQQEMIEYLQEENRVLRDQLGGKHMRFTDSQRRRLARRRLREISTVVTPDTLLRWYRELVAAKYDRSSKRAPGRPRVEGEIQRLIVRMAIEHPRWGYTRIRGALMNLGHEIGRNTVKRVLAENGIDPVGRRPMAWKTFLRAHWGAIPATDFFTVEVVTWRGLARYFVLFVIDLQSRRVEIAGITATPNGDWMQPIARNLVDCEDGFLVNSRHLIHDRGPLFTHAFAGALKRAGVNPVKLPVRSPNLNACAERFVRSIKSECVGQVIPMGEWHLRQVVGEYVEHYHHERNHQGIGNRLIDRCAGGLGGSGPVECHERLGGMLRYYARAAA